MLSAIELSCEFEDRLGSPLLANSLTTLQINVGKLCNQACAHCHVDAGPDRDELMSRATMERVFAALDNLERTEDATITTLDITGGAPELNPNFRFLVRQARSRGLSVIDRCNLTILSLPSQSDLPEFLAEHEVEVVASLPHYRKLNTDAQRGEGVFERSIRGLRRLNEVGYGAGDAKRRLVLMLNPVGAFMPPPQHSTELEWKRELHRLHGITFDSLHTLTNMPISRFLEWLDASGNLVGYVQRLAKGFNPEAAERVMCRALISVGWDGRLYDCDFNQMLELPIRSQRELGTARAPTIDELAPWMARRRIVTGRHCFGCTAGAGSSCGGAIRV